MSAKILENDLHVFVVSWRTQEVLAYRDLKTDEIAVGDENKIQQVGYVAVLTRVEEELDNEETGGWKVIDVRFRSFHSVMTDTDRNCEIVDGTKSSIEPFLELYPELESKRAPQEQLKPTTLPRSFPILTRITPLPSLYIISRVPLCSTLPQPPLSNITSTECFSANQEEFRLELENNLSARHVTLLRSSHSLTVPAL